MSAGNGLVEGRTVAGIKMRDNLSLSFCHRYVRLKTWKEGQGLGSRSREPLAVYLTQVGRSGR